MTNLARIVSVVCAVVAPSLAVADPATHYTLDLSERQTQVLGVTATFEEVETDTLTVHLPVWRTGLYRVLDTVGTVSEVRVTDGRGEPLDFEQTAKSTWVIQRPDAGQGSVSFDYVVYANSLSDRTRDLDADHAFVNPGLALVYAESHRDAPVRVHAELPAGWQTATGMVSDASGVLQAPHYDRLVDSPIEMGPFTSVEFEAAGATIVCAIHGPWSGDAERLEDDVRAMVMAAVDVFGELPTDRYVFIVHSAPGLRGGTEYYNSTVVHTDPSKWWDDDGYSDLMELFAHEFVHTWNVKRFRPAGIARYDYLRENYTDLLWVAEGLTSYYATLLLGRAGLVSIVDLRARFADNVTDVVDRPGYGRDSLAHASFEAWTKGYHAGADRRPDKPNRTVSFYSQGALLGLVLDLELRARSQGETSLDDLMRSLYADFPEGSDGYTYDDVRERIARLADAALAESLDGWVLGTERLPAAESLATVGWTLSRKEPEEPEPTLGIEVAPADGGVRVRSVRLDGPSWQAGLNVNDVLIALDGVRIGGDLDALLARHQPDDAVAITLFRDGQLRTIELTVGTALNDYELLVADEVKRRQRRLRTAWLGGREEGAEDE